MFSLPRTYKMPPCACQKWLVGERFIISKWQSAALLHVLAANPNSCRFHQILHFIIHIASCAIWPLIRQGYHHIPPREHNTTLARVSNNPRLRHISERFCAENSGIELRLPCPKIETVNAINLQSCYWRDKSPNRDIQGFSALFFATEKQNRRSKSP